MDLLEALVYNAEVAEVPLGGFHNLQGNCFGDLFSDKIAGPFLLYEPLFSRLYIFQGVCNFVLALFLDFEVLGGARGRELHGRWGPFWTSFLYSASVWSQLGG